MRTALLLLLVPLALLFCAFGWALVACPAAAVTLFVMYQVHCVVSPSSVRGKRWPLFSEHSLLTTALRRDLGLQFHLPDSLAPSAPVFKRHNQAILAFHPHGVLSEYRLVLDGLLPRAFPGLGEFRGLTASALFHIPGMREVVLWTGCVHASRPVAKRALEHGHSIVVVPGGEKEQVLTEHGKDKVWLRNRKGFVRLAVEHGVPVVPAFVFGSTDLFHTSSCALGLRMWFVDNLRLSVPLFWGPAGLPLPLPGVDLNVVFGDALEFSQDDDVDDAHAKYVTALTELYDKHKARFGFGARSLIVE